MRSTSSFIISPSVLPMTLYLGMDLFPFLMGLVKKRFLVWAHTSSIFAYFSALTNISVKSLGYLFSSEKRKAFLWSLLFKVVIAINWSRFLTSRIAALKWLMYSQNSSTFYYLMLSKESRPWYCFQLVTKYARKEQWSWSKESMEPARMLEYQYQAAPLKVEGKT